MTPHAHDAGWRPLLENGNWLRALVIAGGTGLHAVSIYVVVTIMPLVVADVGGLPFFAWTATLYVAASLASSAAVPLMLSRAGPRTVYRLACLVFALGSLVCATATSMPMLLLGRLLQGIGGGMLPALGYSLVRVIFPPALHARAIVLVGSVWGIAALAGPAIGGLFAQYATWRWAFGIDIVIGAAFVLLSGPVLPAERHAAARPFPGIRLGLLVLAALAVSAGGATSAPIPAALGTVAALALILTTLRLDARSRPRMLPEGAFDLRTPLGAVSATMFLLIMTAAPNTFIPYILRGADGVAPLVGGYVNATYALSWTFISLVTASALRARAMMRLGPILMLAGLALVALALPRGILAAVFAGQVLLGAGIGVGWAHLGALLMQVAAPADRDLAGPFITTTQTLATVFGSAIAGMIANLAGLPAAATPAALGHTAAWLFAVSCLVPAAACLTSARMLTLTGSATK
jgi:MFS family permease